MVKKTLQKDANNKSKNLKKPHTFITILQTINFEGKQLHKK